MFDVCEFIRSNHMALFEMVQRLSAHSYKYTMVARTRTYYLQCDKHAHMNAGDDAALALDP